VSYLVFARKYRPRTFDEVVGQDHVARTLRNALAHGRLAHAYLFCGPRGVGKTTMARLLAREVNAPGDDAPDLVEAILAGNDVDVLEIDAASNRKVEDIEPLVDATRYLPQRSPRKIFIVDEAHMLSKHAWNALLKTLEEPPPHVLFIFATTEPHKVLETVRSRCQRFDFRRIGEADIAGKLRRIAEAEGVAVEDAVFSEIARRATGGMRDAESLFDQAISAAPGDRALSVADLIAILGGIPVELRVRILQLAHGGDMQGVLQTAAEAVEAGADPTELLRDLYGDLRDAAVDVARGEERPYGVEWCLASAEIVARHLRLAADSRAARATADLALLSMARLGSVTDLEEIAARLEGFAGGQPAPVAPRVAPGPDLRAPAPRARADPEKPRTPTPANDKPRLPKLGLRAPPSDDPKAALEPEPVEGQNDRAQQEPLSTEEMARIRQSPRVREILGAFGGQIENVRRIDG